MMFLSHEVVADFFHQHDSNNIGGRNVITLLIEETSFTTEGVVRHPSQVVG